MGTRICVMRDGAIVQIGAPLEVYENPADTFVASFIGNPPTNLVQGEVAQSEGHVVVRAFGRELTLPLHGPACLAPLRGKDVILGIRPEDLYVAEPRADGGCYASIKVGVESVEPLGAETILLLRCDGSGVEITARVERTAPVRAGGIVDIFIDLRACHLFDPDTQLVLTRRSEVDPRKSQGTVGVSHRD